MKSKIFIPFFALLLIGGGFDEGCEEEEPKPDYITVNVSAKGKVRLVEVGNPITVCDQIIQEVPIRVDIIKAGGEQFNFFTSTDINCEFTSETASFKLYREQPIEVKAYIEQVPGGFTQVRGIDYLSWDEVYPQYDFGDVYDYESYVEVKWLEN